MRGRDAKTSFQLLVKVPELTVGLQMEPESDGGPKQAAKLFPEP